MKKLMVFPFTYTNREIVMYRKYMKEYKLVAAVVWNQTDLRFILDKFRTATDVFITDEYEKALVMCDAVLFQGYNNMDISNSIYRNYIQRAFEGGKKVYFSKECQKFLDYKCDECNVEESVKIENTYIKNIDIPAIGIMGLGDFCNKFCCEVEVTTFFREKGYHVIHFGSKDFAGVLGEKRYPDFLFNQSYSVTQRILGWNQYLFDLCNREMPDLIILGMPGGIMPLNNKILNDFGEIPYIIANGIRIDTGVLCSYFYEKVEKRYLTEYKNYCKYKLNCDVEWICISNSSCRFELDSKESILEYLHYEPEIGDKMIIDTKDNEDIHFFNILNSKSRNLMLHRLYEKLTEGVCAF